MTHTLWQPAVFSLFLSLGFVLPALAQGESKPADDWTQWAHMAVTVCGLVGAVIFANQAFGRRQITLAAEPTFPRYMTSRGQYLLGDLAFIVLSAFLFLLIVYLHKEVAPAARLIAPSIAPGIIDAVKTDKSSYVLIVMVMGALFFVILTKEHEWNVLLRVRDLIHSWISIPQLGHQIVAEITHSLQVPEAHVARVVSSSNLVSPSDFDKDRNTVDRRWAEISYMVWWIQERKAAGEDTTFFSEPSFKFEGLQADYDTLALAVESLKSTKRSVSRAKSAADLAKSVHDLHVQYGRLVACYLLYRNNSRSHVAIEARTFGIPFSNPTFDNPLKYSVLFLITIFIAVYVGVHFSAITYDWHAGRPLLDAMTDQNPDLAQRWVLYALGNYGLAISLVLGVRLVIWRAFGGSRSYLMTYGWTFALAFLTGPIGLAITAKVLSPLYQNVDLFTVYCKVLRWGLGPALVSVCISHYLDRQLCSELPDLERSYAFVAKHLVYSVLFSGFTIMLLLPELMALKAAPDSEWTTAKLRWVALGTTFLVTFALSAVAQFGLTKKSPRKRMNELRVSLPQSP